MPTTITISRATQLLTDVDNDGVADAGDILRTFLHIHNVGAQDALNLSVNDNFTGSTLVPGSIKITPIAFDDSYTGVSGNTPITYAANQGVLVNDVDPDGAGGNAGLTVTKVGAVTIGGVIAVTGGTVDMHADGGFIFTPTTGFSGTATFNYTIQDAQNLNNVTTGTVNIQVNGGMVWYVDNSAAALGQDGSYLHPFQQLSSLNGTANNGSSSGDPDGSGDTIFVYHNSATHYTGGITLEAGQKLYGDGQSLLVNGHNIGGTERTGGVDNVSTNSIIDHSGVGVTLSTDNEVKGLDLNGVTSDNAIGIGDGNGTVGTLTVSNVGISGQGQIIDIDQGGTLNVTLNSAASTSNNNGAGNGAIDLNGVQGSFTVTGATTINSSVNPQTGGGIDITAASGSLNVVLQGSVTVNTGASNAINFSNNVLGTSSLTMSSGTKDITTTTGNAVTMTGNVGTTESFTGGNLNIDTTTGTGLNVGGGTINISGASNTIDTTTGPILVATNAAVGASNLAFATLTSTGATTGNAIDINNLDGGTFTAGGVTIANTGTNFDAIHIVGGSSTAFTFNGNTDINGVGANGDGVELNGANGAVSFNNLTVDGMAAGTGNGLLINGATNTVTVGGAIGTGLNTGDAVNITGGTGAVTINASIAKNVAGDIVEVNGHATGAIAFGGAINASGTASGINLVNNTSGNINFTNSAVNLSTGANTALNFTNTASTGAAVTFNGGNLNIDTTSGAGINATSTTTGAGSLTISGANNTVDVTGGGRGVTIDGVTQAVTLLHVNASGGSGTGIFLQNAGSGGFIVTGTGTTAATGGTLNFSAGGADGATTAGIGVYLNNVGNISLANMNFTGTFSNFGIRGDTVNNFTLKDSNLTGIFGNNSAGGISEGTIRFGTEGAANANGLTGTAVFQGNAISGGAKDNLAIFDMGAGTLTFTLQDSGAHQATIGNNQLGGNIGVQIQTGGSAGGQGGGFILVATIDGVTFSGNRGDSVFIEALQHTNQTITVTNNGFTNNQADKLGGFVNVNSSAAAGTNYLVDFNISNNTMTGAVTSPIVAYYKGDAGSISGSINANTIGTPGGAVDNSGSSQGDGMIIALEKNFGAGTLTYAVKVDSNQISDLFQANGGITFRSNNLPFGGASQGTERLEATVSNNSVTQLGAQALSALYAQIGGGGAGDNGILGIDLHNNTLNITGSGAFTSVDLDQITSTSHYIFPGYAGASGAASDAALLSFWTNGAHLNTFPGGGSPTIFGDQSVGITGAAFTLAVPTPLFASSPPPAVPWEDDPANAYILHPTQPATPGGDDQPPANDGGGTPPAGGDTGSDPGSTPPGDGGTPPLPVVVDDGVVSQAELNLIVDAAIQRWTDAGISPEQLAAMRAVSVTVSDMMGLYIGSSSAGQIHIDSDGAGYGWFVDATPGEDSEYEGSGTRLTADAGGPASHRIDLLTVVMHELGHQIGLDDTYAAANAAELMYGYLNPGERRLPGSDDAAGAIPGSLTHEEYAIGPITNISTLPAGKDVDIIFDTQVNVFANQVIPIFHNQATVSGTNFTTSPVTSNVEDLIVDTLTLGDKVYIDSNGNGVFDGTDTGAVGVTLTLYADSNGNGVLDGAELTNVLATATTGAGGAYSFTGLAPGDYVVSVDASNFTGGGVLVGKIPHVGATDPDDNINNDNNGINGPGGTVISNPIRLDYNSETTADGTGHLDINNTLDFAFLPPNQPPVFTGLDGTPSFTEGGAAVVLDGNATVSDPNLTATNYAGASLTLARSGGAVAEDLFAGTGGAGLTLTGVGSGNVDFNGTTVGTYTQSGGTLTISFNASATQSLVNSTLEGLTYTNTSDNPPASTVIAYAFSDGNSGLQGSGGALTATGSVTVSITPVDDPAAAVNDVAATPENATVNIAVLANDSDPDGPPLSVIKINGNSISVGGTAVLASGATVKLEANGTLTYDPNGQYNTLTSTASGETGAVNTSAGDSFTYTLGGPGGGTATVNVTVNGVVSVQDHLDGDAGNNTITGTPIGDFFDLSQGGNDIASGLGGNDGFFFGAAFTAADQVDGGGGANDQIGLQGNYAGGNALVLGANTITNIEAIVVLPGFSYDITTNDGNVAPGGLLKVQATLLAPGQSLTFNGSAEHDGSFLIYGGQGNDSLTGGDGNDGFYFGPGGFNSSDTVDGGPGSNDQLGLDGNYGGFGPAFVLGSNITNVEVVVLLPGPSGTPNTFNLTTSEAFVPAAGTMTIFGLLVTTDITFNGSNEHDGAFRIYGGSGNDVFTGSSGNDWMFGGGGGDTLIGGAGADTFYYDAASQSTSLGFDKIIGFDDNADTIDLPFAVTGFAAPASGNLSTASFDADLQTAFAGLTSHEAGMFTATGGDMSGRTFLVIDADGNPGYQAGSDYVMEIITPATPIDNPGMFV